MRMLAVTLLVAALSACTTGGESSLDDRIDGVDVDSSGVPYNEIVVRCMRSRGFDLELAEVGAPGSPDRFLTVPAYNDALLSTLDQDRAFQQLEFADLENIYFAIQSGDYSTDVGCTALARFHTEFPLMRVIQTLPTPSFDPREDPVILEVLDDWRVCVRQQGVEEIYEAPEDLLTALGYLDYIASGGGNDLEIPQGLPIEEPTREPLSAEQLDEQAALRAADINCAGDFYNRLNTRMKRAERRSL